MPLYAFEDESGAEFDVFLHMEEAPKFCHWVTLNGKKLKRLVTQPRTTPAKSWEFKGWSQPAWAPGADAYDSDGTPCFTSKKGVQRYLDTQNAEAEKSGQGEYLGYGGKNAL